MHTFAGRTRVQAYAYESGAHAQEQKDELRMADVNLQVANVVQAAGICGHTRSQCEQGHVLR